MTEPEPDQPREAVPVVAAVIRRGDTVLVALRPSNKRHSGLWEFPGGKVLDGESRLEAVRRELGEELDIRVLEIGQVLFSARDPEAPFVIHFLEAVIEGEPRALEHEELRWATADELRGLKLAPADQRFVAEGLSLSSVRPSEGANIRREPPKRSTRLPPSGQD